MKTISGIVRNISSTGAVLPVADRIVYAVPTPLEMQVQLAGQWSGIWANTGLPAPYSYGIQAKSNLSGLFTFTLPQVSESQVPGGLSPQWIIIDPLTGIAYRGEVRDAIVSPVTLKQLIDSYEWTVSSHQVGSGPAPGSWRFGVATFNASTGTEVAVPLIPPMPNGNYAPVTCNITDDLGTTGYFATIKAGWTASEFRILLSDAVPVGRTVNVPWHILG